MSHSPSNFRSTRASLRFLIAMRWALILLAPFMFGISTVGTAGNVMWWALGAFACSNLVLIVRMRQPMWRWSHYLGYLAILIDLLVITVVVIARGGLRTDSYLLYLLIMSEAGIMMGKREAWAVTLGALGLYGAAVLWVDGPGGLPRLFIREIYMIMVGLATMYLAAAEKRALFDSLTDSKTNLPNFRHFQDLLTTAFAHHRAQGLPMAVAIVDVDNFRQLNAEVGHPVADAVLEQLAELMLRFKNPTCTLARYGGEEFVALMPGMRVEEAVARVETVRRAIAEHRFVVPGLADPVRITVSAGVAALASDSTEFAILSQADRALMRAKAKGKNRTCTFDDMAEVS